MAWANTLYLASDDDSDTVACFLLLHEMRDIPRKKQYPVIDLRVSEHVPQSESLKTFSLSSLLVGKKRPYAGASLMYRRTLIAAA